MTGPGSLRTPALVILVFSMLIVGVTAYTVVESQRLAEREVIVRPTGLEDRELYVEQGIPIGGEVIRVEGQPLYRVQTSPASKQDWRMYRIQREDSDRYWVYREEPPEGSDREVDPAIRYLKLGKDAWLRLTYDSPAEPTGDST